jgi:hypothetical protein
VNDEGSRAREGRKKSIVSGVYISSTLSQKKEE